MPRILNIAALDLRSLAVFRLLISLAAIFDAAVYDGLLALLLMLAATIFFFGYRSQLSAVAVWLLTCTLHAFDPAGPAAGNTLLPPLLLLSVFLPVGRHYSVDQALDVAHDSGASDKPSPSAAEGEAHRSIIALALTIQILLILFIAGLASLRSANEVPAIITVLDWLCVGAPLYVLYPAAGQWPRATGVLMLAGTLLCSALFLPQGVPVVALLAALAVLVPAVAWRWLERVIDFDRGTGLRIYFDRDCGFCRKTCILFRTFFVLGDAVIMPAQNDKEANEIMRREVTWVVYDSDDTPFVRWHAVVLLLRRSPVFWPLGKLLSALRMGDWGDPIYAAIATSRWWLSKLTGVVLPFRRERTRVGPVVSALAGAWLIALPVLISRPPLPVPTAQVAKFVHTAAALEQRWHLW